MTEPEDSTLSVGSNEVLCSFRKWAEVRDGAPSDRVVTWEYEKNPKIPEKVVAMILKTIETQLDKDSESAAEDVDLSQFDPFTPYRPKGEVHYFNRAQGIVGMFPFLCDECGCPHILVVGPKVVSGKPDDVTKGLSRVCDMAARARQNPDIVASSEPRWLRWAGQISWSGTSADDNVWTLIALQYVVRLEELLSRDFRRYYVPHEEVLHGRVKGRLLTSRYLERLISGRPVDLPCRWQDFTYDNWDNRILETALTECSLRAHPGSDFASFIFSKLNGGPFRASFDEVRDVRPWELDWSRSKLGSVSPLYRDCLALADQILRSKGGGAPTPPTLQPTWVYTNLLFEDFVAAIVAAAAHESGCKARVQDQSRRLFHKDGKAPKGTGPNTKPDAIVLDPTDPTGHKVKLVVDAKYKSILAAFTDRDQANTLEKPEDIEAGLFATEDTTDNKIQAKKPLKIINADMFQLFFYLKSRECSQGLIVFPFWDAKRDSPTYPKKGLEMLWHEFNVPETSRSKVAFLGLNLAENIDKVFADGTAIIASLLKTS